MAMSSIECLAERVRMISEEFYWELFEDIQHAKIMHQEEMIEVFHAGMDLHQQKKSTGIAEEFYVQRFNTKECYSQGKYTYNNVSELVCVQCGGKNDIKFSAMKNFQAYCEDCRNL